MKHDWEDIHGELPPMKALSVYGARRCKNCGAEQVKEPQHLWGRITGYIWYPKAGRCKEPK